ncbi:fibronectin type III domain-containing protein [Saccharopolyspora erythraea]|uniref:fibronectin type III domain-containing protein n=1 Tax=Saccharopolyspora erythraea TaxID=1836 RepID=UPI001BA46035|nr:fibronectin type III domain-containing protein [Saccharopolyspora erythraea]QUH03927.1 fibronectin type III domain-containing protein [Saccharopolyspora erythraea]
MSRRKLWHRLPVALLVVACAATLAIAVSGASESPRGLAFAPSGHWIANPDLDIAFHVNGAAKAVDAQAPVAIDPGSRVYQGETSAYVVGQARITEFGKSTLEVERTITPPTGERPVGMEAPGGPYLVYREAGTVVRLGEQPATIRAGQGLGDPVVTPDGTLWLHRLASGVLCKLPKGADQVSCPTVTPPGQSGQLTVVGRQAAFVDTTQDTVRVVADGQLGDPVDLGVDLPATAEVGTADSAGRIPVLDPAKHQLHLVDGGRLTTPKPPAKPVTVQLPEGEYAGPEPSGSSVVLLDLRGNTARTYTGDGTPPRVTPIPPETGEPRLTRGEDGRVYIDGDKGGHVMVVDADGAVSQVPLVGEERPDGPDRPQAPPAEREPEPAPRPEPRRDPEPAVLAEHSPIREPDQVARGEQPQPPPPPKPRPTPEPPPAPKPVPASPPGIATGLTATPQGNTVQLTWGAAAPNGAPVTAYHVTWQPATGAGSLTVPGNARSAVLSGLDKGVSYTVTVVAENSAGRGTRASTQVVIPARTITVTRGPDSDYPGCGPDCAEMHIEATGLEPNTEYHFNPYSNAPGWENPGPSWKTDENGNVSFDDIDFGEVGYQVWIVIEEIGLTSERYTWPAG